MCVQTVYQAYWRTKGSNVQTGNLSCKRDLPPLTVRSQRRRFLLKSKVSRNNNNSFSDFIILNDDHNYRLNGCSVAKGVFHSVVYWKTDYIHFKGNNSVPVFSWETPGLETTVTNMSKYFIVHCSKSFIVIWWRIFLRWVKELGECRRRIAHFVEDAKNLFSSFFLSFAESMNPELDRKQQQPPTPQIPRRMKPA